MKQSAVVALVGLLAGVATPTHAELSCNDWMTEAFFSAATVQDVRNCLMLDVDIAQRDHEGRTPLHLAATAAVDAAVAAELLSAGADIELTDVEGRRPIHTAAEFGRTPSILTFLLVWGSDPNAQLPGKRCSRWGLARCSAAPLHYAAARRDGAEHVAALLAAGADLDQRDEEHRTALHHAAANSVDALSVTLLLKAGAKIDISDIKGFTPLHLAARRGEGAPIIIDALLVAGASPDVGDVNGTTPVIWAARTAPDSSIVEKLIKAAEKEACTQDKQGRTALSVWNDNDNLVADSIYWALHDRCSK